MSTLKTTVKQLLGQLLCLFSRRGCIVFESMPDFSDNTYPVFTELLQRGFDKKYTLVWSCSQRTPLPGQPKNIRYIYPKEKNIFQKLRTAYYMANAKSMISCNRFLLPWRKSQLSFFLTHGTPIKNIRGYYTLPDSITHCLAASPDLAEHTAFQHGFDPKKMFALGFPRNDILTQKAADVKKMLQTDCSKVIVWYPTFRQHRGGRTAGSGKALPVIHDAQAALALNAWASQMDVLLVLKPHFVQNVAQIKDLQLSNIRFIDDSFFTQHSISSYGFVAGCDALITDYSSIYFDYTLCDKPIGLIWEDLEEYRKNPGFALDIDECGKGGVKIYILEDFKAFLQQVAEGNDVCAEERRKLRDIVNYSTDGNNTQRVTDYIIEQAKL